MTRLRLVMPRLALALVASVPYAVSADCVVGSGVKVREAPQSSARVVGTLFIGTGVSRAKDAERDGWVRVSYQRLGDDPGRKGPKSLEGWVRGELVADRCVSYEEALAQAADDSTPVMWYERAAALAQSRPQLTAALEGWTRALEATSDPGAGRTRAQLEAIRDAASLAQSHHERSLVVAVSAYSRAVGAVTVFPLTYAGSELGRFRWESQWEATNFLVHELPVGRKFGLVSDGPGGTVTISEDPSFDIAPESREASMEATGRLDLAPGEKGSSWLASDGGVRSAAPGRPLTAAERTAMVRIAGRAFEEAVGKNDEALTAAARLALRSGDASGSSKDLDGDGRPELVSLVRFHSTTRPLDGYVLLIARREDGTYRTQLVETHTSVPGGEDESRFELLGSADLNGDGKEEVVVAFWGYIYASIQILVPVDGQFKRVEVAHWAS